MGYVVGIAGSWLYRSAGRSARAIGLPCFLADAGVVAVVLLILLRKAKFQEHDSA